MTKGRSRSLAAVLVAVVAACVALAACAETRRTLGEDCLKSEDCLSGICASLKCAAEPPILGTSPTPTSDAGPDVVASDGGAEGGDAAEAGGDGGGDAATD